MANRKKKNKNLGILVLINVALTISIVLLVVIFLQKTKEDEMVASNLKEYVEKNAYKDAGAAGADTEDAGSTDGAENGDGGTESDGVENGDGGTESDGAENGDGGTKPGDVGNVDAGGNGDASGNVGTSGSDTGSGASGNVGTSGSDTGSGEAGNAGAAGTGGADSTDGEGNGDDGTEPDGAGNGDGSTESGGSAGGNGDAGGNVGTSGSDTGSSEVGNAEASGTDTEDADSTDGVGNGDGGTEPSGNGDAGDSGAFTDYAKYDNTKYGWCFERKSDHVPSGTYEGFDISKYNAFYLDKNAAEDDKVIYLAFDCGYEYGFTSKILDILKEEGVHAVFFVTKPFLKSDADLAIRMKEEGHLVGNHTVNHPSMPGESIESVKNELTDCEEYFEEVTGYKMDKYFRPPMGEYSERVLKIAQDMGYRSIFWSIAYADYDVDNQPGKQYVVDHFKKYYHNGAITLTHTVSESNTEALKTVIEYLKEKGFRFGSVADL